ncbi:hypothetical protein JCM8547_002744 [Rhodosporidiobolus lusitaniae]
MLDRLPVELVRHILELAVSSQAALRGLAQPLLWRIFRPEEDHLPLVVQSPHLAKHIRAFHPRLSCDDPQRVFDAVELMPALHVFRVIELEDVEEDDLWILANTRHLVLKRCQTDGFGTFAFPNLVSLTLLRLLDSSCYEDPYPNAEHFPHLRAFFTDTLFEKPGWKHELKLLRGGPPGQLDMLQVCADSFSCFPPDLLHQGTPVLITFKLSWSNTLREADLADFEHFDLDPFRNNNGGDSDDDDDDMWSSIPTYSSRDALLEVCAARKIEVLWRLDYQTKEDGWTVSKSFGSTRRG